MVRDHYGFVKRPEPPVQYEPPVWHGPVRVKRPVRTVIWWEKKDNTEPSEEFEEINLRDEIVKPGEQLLHRLLGEPDPAALGIVRYLTVADLNSLKYVCKSFNHALTGDGVWAWILTKLTFGNEYAGGCDAFNGLRRLTNRIPFWDTPSVQKIINRWDIVDVLVNVNLDSAGVDASCIEFFLEKFHSIKRISVRYCIGFKLAEFLTILQAYADQGKKEAKRLENIFIDYWGVAEIYSVVGTMVLDQALIDETTYVASKIRYITQLIESNVFLCYRNHYEEGLWGPDKTKFRQENGEEATFSTFYPSEIVLIRCALCNKVYERRWCLRCLKANICTYCNDYHCLTCDPASYAESISGKSLFQPSSGLGTGGLTRMKLIPEGHSFTLARLHEFDHCCSDVSVFWNLKHHFHDQCATQARRLERCLLCNKFICWNIPGLHCPRCAVRQCPHSSGYCMRMCQFCKNDYAYTTEYRSVPARAALINKDLGH
ncbi:hypothetical protein TWF106_002986 [Orbilia oligospora]|uniref:F-box domain-containing protein n=1 Tax=Orbilia oligospora TaxID=2813651 RepID=A0A7C8QUC6_ORBOL|nr:hypothetical protein TWF106_002986 [Orbilia oligospora]